MKRVFIRTCQECGYKHETPVGPMPGEASNAHIFRKCRKCRSEAYDYGSYQLIAETPEEQKQMDEDNEEDY